tara:strand:+ start:2977 stop:4488 length:1512 start_codon:yes stop_codon:yes gene_type:complete
LSYKVTLYEPFGLHLQLFETTLEIAQKHLDKGDLVTIITCDGILPICEINRKKSLTVCARCISRRKNGLQLLNPKPDITSINSFYKAKDRNKARSLRTNFESIEDLKSYKLENFSIGTGVYSSLLDRAQNHQPVLSHYQNEIRDSILSSFFVFASFDNYLKEMKPDLVYLFNGRHATGRPVLDACRLNKTDFRTYEYHYYQNQYKVFNNTQPHDFLYRVQRANDLWNDSRVDQKSKEKIGSSFFKRDETNNLMTRDITKSQKKKLLPHNWDIKKHNIVFFTNSEFESYAAFEFKEESVYEDHFLGIKAILNSLQEIPHNLHIYIRLHPFLSSAPKAKDEVLQYNKITLPYVTIIRPDDPVESSELLKQADKIVTYISSISMEAVFHKKPTILLSKHFTAFMGGCYLPNTHGEVMNLLLEKNLPALDSKGALKFGYYWENCGEKYKFYVNKSIEDGLFKNVKVDVSPFVENVLLKNYHRPKLNKFRKFLEFLFKIICKKYITGF